MISARVDRRGFTIVELLIVVVVIAILAAVTIVAYTGISNSARLSAVQSEASQASRKVMLYQSKNGTLPASLADAGVSDTDSVSYQYRNYGDDFCVSAASDGVSQEIVNGEPPIYGDCVNIATSVYSSSSDFTFNITSDGPVAGGTLAKPMSYGWGAAAIVQDAPIDRFVAEFTGFITPPITDTYTFVSGSDDRDQLYINGQLIIDDAVSGTGTVYLEAGKPVRFKVVFKENAGSQSYSLSWYYTGQTQQAVPAGVINAEP